MKNQKKKDNKIINFPRNLSKLERQVEAILFAAEEPLDIQTIESRTKTNFNIKKILENIINKNKKDFEKVGATAIQGSANNINNE